MTSAKLFGQALLSMGPNSWFAKTDVENAYKLLHCRLEERPFFGFTWLGKFFFDISTPFGSKAAPANFDDLNETLVYISATLSKTPLSWVFKQLDDVPVLCPQNSSAAQQFYATYQAVCAAIGVPLAPHDPNRIKAFTPGQTGTVLGICFRSSDLSWKFPPNKWHATISLLDQFFNNKLSLCFSSKNSMVN